VSRARPRTCGEIVGLAIAPGRALAGRGSTCRTADGPVPAFTYRDQLTLHLEPALAQTPNTSGVASVLAVRVSAHRLSGSAHAGSLDRPPTPRHDGAPFLQPSDDAGPYRYAEPQGFGLGGLAGGRLRRLRRRRPLTRCPQVDPPRRRAVRILAAPAGSSTRRREQRLAQRPPALVLSHDVWWSTPSPPPPAPPSTRPRRDTPRHRQRSAALRPR
jgi:hypothetical protein